MISGITSGGLKPSAAALDTKEVSEIRQREDEAKAQEQSQPQKPIRDEYIPSDKSEPDSKPEICRGSTDKVDREIEKLKKELEELKQKIGSETDETKIRQLESRLKQVEGELRQKDNDAYRRQHMVTF